MRTTRINLSLPNFAHGWAEAVRLIPWRLMHPIPLLTGLAMGWQWLGLSVILASAINPSPSTAMRLGIVSLLAAALGPWLPERIVLAVLRFIVRYRYGKDDADADAAANFWMLRAIRQRDQSLLWLSLSVLACIAGVLALFALLFGGRLFQIYHFMLARFYWSHLTLTALEWCIVAAWVSIPWLINGLVIATLAPVLGTPAHSQRDLGGVASGVVSGLGLSWILHRIWADVGLSGHQVYLLGVLAIFLLAALSAWLSQHAARTIDFLTDPETDAPEIGGGGERLIWLSLVAWGIASTSIMMGWLATQSTIPSQGHTSFGAGPLMLLLGLGVSLASFHARSRTSSASGCGMALWAAGVCAALVATLAAFQSSPVRSPWLEAVLLSFPVGYALHYAERAWLARVGSETVGFAQLITAIFGGLAIGLLVGYWWVLPRLGPIGTISVGSLLMLAFGGFVQIHERYRPIHTQHLRLALIFASLAVATVLFPADVKRWTIRERSIQAAANVTVGLDPALLKQVSQCRHVCIIQSDPAALRYGRNVDIVPLAPPIYESPMDPLTWLRLEHRGYDLIYQRGRPAPAIARFGEYAIEWLTQLNENISPDGQLCIDVPLTHISREAIAVIAATFAQATGPSAGWILVSVEDRPFLRLQAHGGHAAVGPTQGYADIAYLMEGMTPVVHSLARDRLTRAIPAKHPDSPARLLSWLEQCRARGLARLER